MENRKTIVLDKYSIWSMFFGIWFVTEYCLYHSIFNTIAVALFICISILFIVKFGIVRFNAIVPWISFFVIVCFLNVYLGYSLNDSYSYEMIVSLLKDLVFLIALVGYVRAIGTERFKDLFIILTFISSFVIIVISIAVSGSIIVRGANGIFNANYLAVCGSITSIIILSREDSKISKRLLLVLYLTFFGVLAGTRKAILALIVGIIVFVCSKYPKKLLRNTLIVLGIMITIYFALIKIPYLYNAIGYRFVAVSNFLNGQSGDSSIYVRSVFIRKGMDEFKKSPIIGWGINCFKTLPGSLDTYSHNNYVELLFSVGIIGTIEFYSIHLFSIIYALVKRKSIDKTCFCLGLSIISIVLFVDFSMVSYYERGSLIYIVLFYMLLVESRLLKKEQMK